MTATSCDQAEGLPRSSLSSFCRFGEHTRCENAGARCTCRQHGPQGQQARQYQPKETTMAAPLRSVADNPIRRSPAAETPPQPTGGLIWRDPPTRGSGAKSPLTADFLEQIKARPGEWAMIKTYPSKSGANTAAKAIRNKDSKVQARGCRSEGGSELYVRWAG